MLHMRGQLQPTFFTMMKQEGLDGAENWHDDDVTVAHPADETSGHFYVQAAGHYARAATICLLQQNKSIIVSSPFLTFISV